MIEYQILGGLFDLDKKILRAKEINNLPKNDTVTGIKTVNYDYGKII